MTRALAGDPSEQGAGGALPRELGELVGRGDDQVRQEPIDLLVDAHDRDALALGALGRERAAAFGIAAGDEGPPQLGMHLGVALGIQGLPAPRAGHQRRRSGSLGPAGVLQVVEAPGHVLGLVGADRAADPHTDPERSLAPALVARRHQLAPANLARTDERGRTLKLLGRQQPQRVAHQHTDATLARVSTEFALEATQGERERGQAQVSLGLAATGREEQKVGSAGIELPLGVRRIGERRKVHEDEGELERPPRPVRRRRDQILGLGKGQFRILAPGDGH